MVDEGFFGTIETHYPSLHWDLFVVSKESESSLWKCLRSQNFLISKATYASRREKFWPDPWLCFFLLFWYCAWSQDRFVQKICEDLKKGSLLKVHNIKLIRANLAEVLVQKKWCSRYIPRSYGGWSRAARWDITSLNAALEKLGKKHLLPCNDFAFKKKSLQKKTEKNKKIIWWFQICFVIFILT